MFRASGTTTLPLEPCMWSRTLTLCRHRRFFLGPFGKLQSHLSSRARSWSIADDSSGWSSQLLGSIFPDRMVAHGKSRRVFHA